MFDYGLCNSPFPVEAVELKHIPKFSFLLYNLDKAGMYAFKIIFDYGFNSSGGFNGCILRCKS